MISTLNLLSAIQTTLHNVSANAYLNIAPQNAAYPFVTYTVISTPTEYTFTDVMTDVRIQFSIFDNQSNLGPLLSTASTVERAFEEYQTTGIYCSHCENEVGPFFNDKDHYWQHNMDYIFKCQRSKV